MLDATFFGTQEYCTQNPAVLICQLKEEKTEKDFQAVMPKAQTTLHFPKSNHSVKGRKFHVTVAQLLSSPLWAGTYT